MKASVFIGTSLDGFIARDNGDFDFLPPGGGEPHGYEEFMATVDALVIGRKTFETVLGFDAWPYGEKPVFVLSTRALPPPLPAPWWGSCRGIRPTSWRSSRLAAYSMSTWMAESRFSGFCGPGSFNASSSHAFLCSSVPESRSLALYTATSSSNTSGRGSTRADSSRVSMSLPPDRRMKPAMCGKSRGLMDDKVKAWVAIGIALLLSGRVVAQGIVMQRNLSLPMAKTIAEATLAHCKSKGYNTSVAVVDRAGQVLVIMRDEQATTQTAEMARRKAYTARMFRTTTMEFQKRTEDPARAGQRDLVDILALSGGVPIQVGDDTIGAVGSAGSTLETDDACSKAGIAKVADLLK